MDTERGMTRGSWASWCNLVVAIWTFFSPWILHFSGNNAPTWNSVIFGVLIAAAALTALQSTTATPSWWNVAFGVWLIVSPFILAFSTVSPAMASDVVCGIIVGVLALSVAMMKSPGIRTRAPGA